MFGSIEIEEQALCEGAMKFIFEAAKDVERRGFLLVPHRQVGYSRLEAQQLKIAELYYSSLVKYCSKLDKELYNNWFKMIGCLRCPPNGKGAQNHLFIIDNGLISDFLQIIFSITKYQARSALVLNHFLGMSVADKRKIGKIHLHVWNVRIFENFKIPELLQTVQKEHSYTNLLAHRALIYDFLEKRSRDLLTEDLEGLRG
ncbi:MAG: hypothetical protein R3B41_01915 [Candidatus Doudnabacteria bacterium]